MTGTVEDNKLNARLGQLEKHELTLAVSSLIPHRETNYFLSSLQTRNDVRYSCITGPAIMLFVDVEITERNIN